MVNRKPSGPTNQEHRSFSAPPLTRNPPPPGDGQRQSAERCPRGKHQERHRRENKNQQKSSSSDLNKSYAKGEETRKPKLVDALKHSPKHISQLGRCPPKNGWFQKKKYEHGTKPPPTLQKTSLCTSPQ